MANWTRDEIIRELLRREASGLTLTVGRKTGVEASLYQAARRVFGSWPNAIAAAGIPIEKAISHERWPPARILSSIQSLARRKHPLRPKEFNERYSNLAAAARRVFGSWPRAVIAAGADPGKLRAVPQWTPERVIEGILTRALKNEPLRSRSVQPKALVDAGVRIFGNWSGALAAAGIDAHGYRCHATPMQTPESAMSDRSPSDRSSVMIADQIRRLEKFAHVRGLPWTDEAVAHAILIRHSNRLSMESRTVHREERSLLRASISRFGSWSNALLAAGLNPEWRQ
jgi:hypothetical protein